MSRLQDTARVYLNADLDDPDAKPVICAWFARCTNPANGLRRGPILGSEDGFGPIPICQRCDDKIERLGA